MGLIANTRCHMMHVNAIKPSVYNYRGLFTKGVHVQWAKEIVMEFPNPPFVLFNLEIQIFPLERFPSIFENFPLINNFDTQCTDKQTIAQLRCIQL